MTTKLIKASSTLLITTLASPWVSASQGLTCLGSLLAPVHPFATETDSQVLVGSPLDGPQAFPVAHFAPCLHPPLSIALQLGCDELWEMLQ